MSTKRTRPTRLLALLAAVALVVAACGDDDDETGGASGASDSGGEQSADQELRHLTIGVTPTAAVAPAWLADLYGTYEDAGLDVEIVNFRAAVDLIAAGASGSLDLMATGIEQPAFLAAQGAGDWRDIVALLGSSSFSIVMQPDLDIEPGDFGALEGMTIGIPGVNRPGHSVVKALVAEGGLDPDNDVEYVEQPSGAEGIVAWEQRRADLAVVNEPVTSALLSRDSAVMFADLRDGSYGPLSQVPQAAVLASTDLIESDRPTLDAFVGAICQAASQGRDDPEGAAEMLAEEWSGGTDDTDPEVLRAGIEATAPAWQAELPEEPVNAWLDMLSDAGTLESPATYDDVVDTSFTDLWAC